MGSQCLFSLCTTPLEKKQATLPPVHHTQSGLIMCGGSFESPNSAYTQSHNLCLTFKGLFIN